MNLFIELLTIDLQPLGYSGVGQFVAFWWEPMVSAVAWADDTGNSAVGQGNDQYWQDHVCFPDFDFGGGQHVLIWERRTSRIWVAPREEGMGFLGRLWRERQ